jgi:hypothetical protein
MYEFCLIASCTQAGTIIVQKAKTVVILVVCLPWPLEHKSHPHMGIGRPPFEEPYGSSGVHTEDDYDILLIIITDWSFT